MARAPALRSDGPYSVFGPLARIDRSCYSDTSPASGFSAPLRVASAQSRNHGKKGIHMIPQIRVLAASFVLGFAVSATAAEVDPSKHFDPLGKPPSEHTLKVIAEDAAGLPFDDVRDFAEAEKGFIAEPDSWKVVGPAGNVVWAGRLCRVDRWRN